nr:hypothetical protein [Tanacetum cinerariifolium]
MMAEIGLVDITSDADACVWSLANDDVGQTPALVKPFLSWLHFRGRKISSWTENIEYVEASPHDSELVSLEAAEIVITKVEEIEDDNLHEKLLNVHLLIANIEALKDNPTPSFKLLTKIRENLPSATSVNLPIEDDYSPLLAYVVWIFLGYLTYPVIPPYLHPFGNEDTIFDPGITINHFYLFKPGSSHRHGAFKKFNTHHSHLNEWPMIINGKNTPILDVLLFHFYPL